MEQILISVVMPVYNENPKYLNKAILSILGQTVKSLELIIVDDGSSPKVDIKDINDSRIVLLTLKKNMGISHALNKGISIARGIYIARMDSDDISHINRFEHQLRIITKHDIISSNIYLIDEKDNRVGRSLILPFHNFIRRFQLYKLKKNPVNHPTIFAKAKVFEYFKYNEGYRVAQDHELWIRMKEDFLVYFDSTYVLDYRTKIK
jgi:glycosyltransferase involved in cell wall biosynthesis